MFPHASENHREAIARFMNSRLLNHFWHKLNNKNIDAVTFNFTDDEDSLIYLNGTDISVIIGME